VRGKRDFPMMFAQDNKGNWWVTQPTASAGPHADILVYDPDHGVKARVDLPKEVFAFDIAPMANRVIVSELDGYKLHSIDTDSFEVNDFGDEQFNALLSQTQQTYQYYKNTSNQAVIAMIVFAVLMITAAVFATPKDKRWSKRPQPVNLQPSDTPMPKINGIYWLKRNPGIDRYLIWGEPIAYGLTIVLIAILMAVFPEISALSGKAADAKEQRTFQMLLQMLEFMTVMFLPLPFMTRISFNAVKRTLGTDGSYLYIKLRNGQQLLAHPKDLLYTKASIIFQQYTLPLQNGYQKPFYEDGELQTYISPLLKQARKVNSWQLFKHLWAHRNPVLIFNMMYFLVTGVGLFWFWLRIKGYA